MKYIQTAVAFFATCIFAACSEEKQDKPTEPKAEVIAELPSGTIIAADSIPIAEEKLNNFMFSVKISTTAKTNKGKYKVDAAWGYNAANSEIAMPRNDYPLVPVLKLTDAPYTYLIGFYLKDDTTFYDYYTVKAERGAISMGYTKGYRFQ